MPCSESLEIDCHWLGSKADRRVGLESAQGSAPPETLIASLLITRSNEPARVFNA